MASGVQRSLGVVKDWGCRQLQIVFVGEVVELCQVKTLGSSLDGHSASLIQPNRQGSLQLPRQSQHQSNLYPRALSQ